MKKKQLQVKDQNKAKARVTSERTLISTVQDVL